MSGRKAKFVTVGDKLVLRDAGRTVELNPNNTNLVDNLGKLNLPVDRILPLHGRVVPAAELYTAVGAKPPQ